MGRSQFNNEFTAMVQFGQFDRFFLFRSAKSSALKDQGLSTAKMK